MSIAAETEPLLETEPRASVSLAVPAGLRLKVSPEDFWTLCLFNRDLRLERNAQGELIAMSPAGSESGALNFQLCKQLGIWADTDKTGIGFDSSAGFTLPNGAVRAPDAAWITLDRWKTLTKRQRAEFAPIVPDFVVELCSPSDTRADTRAKMVEYLEQGVRLGWLIDARTPEFEVEIHRPGRPAETLSKPQTVSGEDVLAGFTLELGKFLTDWSALK